MRFVVRRLLIPIAVLVALFLAGNLVIQRVAESRIADAARTSFGLNSSPQVSIEGFPILLHIMSGRLPGVSFEVRDLDIEGLQVRELVVRMRELSADGGLLRTDGLQVSIERGEVRAEATDEAVTAFLREQGHRADISFATNRRATVRMTRRIAGERRRIVATGTVELLAGPQQLRFIPEEVTLDGEPPPGPLERQARGEATFTVDLPALPGGFRVTTLQSGEGYVVIVAVFEDFRFPDDHDQDI